MNPNKPPTLQVEDARAVLQAVRERSGDKPDEILVNIAHLFTAQQVGRWVGGEVYICFFGVCVGGEGMRYVCTPIYEWTTTPHPITNPPPPPHPLHQGQRNAAIHCYETFLKKRPPGTAGGGTDAALHGKVLEYVAHTHYLDKRFQVGG